MSGTSGSAQVSKRISVVGGVTMNEVERERLASFGELTFYEDETRDPAEVLRRIGECEIVVTGASPVDATVMRGAPNLELVAIWSTGFNHVDVPEAARRGIVVCNAPGFAAVSVGEHALALALALAKNLPQADRHVRDGGYDWSAFWGMQLAGKTFGVVGTGAIGSHVAKLARCFGCRVLATTKHPSARRAAELGVEFVPLDTLLAESHVICLCAQLTEETEGLIGRREFHMMEKKPILVNVGRGRLLDQEALLEALRSGKISGAGLDVLAQEPPAADEPLLREERVILSPHHAAVTPECLSNLTRLCIDTIEAYLQGEPRNVVS